MTRYRATIEPPLYARLVGITDYDLHRRISPGPSMCRYRMLSTAKRKPVRPQWVRLQRRAR